MTVVATSQLDIKYKQILENKKIIGFFSSVPKYKSYYFQDPKYISTIFTDAFTEDGSYIGNGGNPLSYLQLNSLDLRIKSKEFYDTLNKSETPTSGSGSGQSEKDAASSAEAEGQSAKPYLQQYKNEPCDENKIRIKGSSILIDEIFNAVRKPRGEKDFKVWKIKDENIMFVDYSPKGGATVSATQNSELQPDDVLSQNPQFQNGFKFEDIFTKPLYNNFSKGEKLDSHRKQFHLVSCLEFPGFYLDFRHEVDAFVAVKGSRDTLKKCLKNTKLNPCEVLQKLTAVEVKSRKYMKRAQLSTLLDEYWPRLFISNSDLVLGLWEESKETPGAGPLTQVLYCKDAKRWDEINNTGSNERNWRSKEETKMRPTGEIAMNFLCSFLQIICDQFYDLEHEREYTFKLSSFKVNSGDITADVFGPLECAK